MLLLLCILLQLTQLISADQLCQTPNHQLGNCKPIVECQPLFRSYPITNSIRIKEFIRRSHCGFTKKTERPKVCCPLGTPKGNLENSTIFINDGLLPSAEICGKSHTKQNFTDGRTELGEFPWMALLEYNETGTINFECGGFLINHNHVLTAAHCAKTDLASVRLGEWNTQTDPDCLDDECAPPYKSIPIEEQIIFKSYNSSDASKPHDIALLRLKKEVEYNDYIRPICLPNTVEELLYYHRGKKLTVAGWGKISTDLDSSIKHKVEVPVTSLHDCMMAAKKLNTVVSLDSGHICAGGEDGKDSCDGDSGGPLMLQKRNKNNDNWYAIGIVSFGSSRCGVKDRPAVYVRVSKYMHWIVDVLRGEI